MVIAKELLDKWKALRSPEDSAKLARRLEGGYPEIFARAFRTGKCNDQVFKIMAEYYEKKAKVIKQYL